MPIPRQRYGLLSFVLWLSMVGCSTAPGPASELVGSTGLPQAVIPPGQMTVEQLRNELLRFADLAMSEMRRVSTTVDPTRTTTASRAYVQASQADVASVAVALAIEPDPEVALQDLISSVSAKRLAAAGPRSDSVEAAAAAEVLAALTALEKEIVDIGTGVYDEQELATLRGRVNQWWSEGSKSPYGVVRAADLPSAGGGTLTKGLFSPIVEANRQLEEARMLGERFLFLAERLPTITLWQTQAAAWDIATAPESQRALESMVVITTAVESLALRVDSLPALLDGQREAFLSAFDEREGTVGGLLAETGVVVRDAAPLVESGERLAGLSNEAIDRLNETLLASERLLTSLRDTSAPGGPVSLDVEDYASALTDFRASAEALTEALGRAETMVEVPRDLIDHAAWRVAQLLFLFFGLLVAYRFGMAAWERRNSG